VQLPLRVLTIAVLALFTAMVTHPTASAANAVVARSAALLTLDPTPAELALFHLSNDDRARAGLPQLRFDIEALAVARARAAAQPSNSPLTHFDAAGKMAFADMLGDSGLTYDLAGENLARVAGPASVAAERAEEGLMNSPTHRANILEPSFELLAVGSTIDSEGRVVFAQVFRSTP